MRIEEVKGYKGLYGEVVEADVYRLRNLTFTPDLIFDIGANIGVFAGHSASLFPDARIICVEPDDANFDILRSNGPKNATLLQKALGKGKIWRAPVAITGAHECYVGVTLGYPLDSMNELEENASWEPVDVETVSVAGLFDEFWKPGDKVIVKVDCEGAETTIFDDKDSMECLKKSDYITMEIHLHAHHGGVHDEVVEVTQRQMKALSATHDCWQEHPLFHAEKSPSPRKWEGWDRHDK